MPDNLIHEWLMFIREEILCRAKRSGLPEAAKALADFEKARARELEGTYLHSLRTSLPPHEWSLMTYCFFRNRLPEFDREINTLLKDAKPFKDTIAEAFAILYDDEEILRLQSLLCAAPLSLELFDISPHGQLSLRNAVVQKMINNGKVFVQPSKDYDIIEPKATFDDVVLTHENRQRLLDLVTAWKTSPEKRPDFRTGVKGTVPVLQFEGLPGTGKSLTAEAFANALGLPLVKVRFEDERRSTFDLGRLVAEINAMECVLLLDDFEKILDRFMARRIPEFLSALESSSNIILLTVNDGTYRGPVQALSRRVTHNLFFGIPDRKMRKKLWLRHLPDGFSFASPEDLDFLSRMYLLPGGSVKNVLLNYSYNPSAPRQVTSIELKKLVLEERAKILNSVDQYIHVWSHMDYPIDKRLSSRLLPLIGILNAEDATLKRFPSPLRIGLSGEHEPAAVCLHLSALLAKPVIMNSFFSENRDPDEWALYRIFEKSLPPGESVTLNIVRSVENLDPECVGTGDQPVLFWPLFRIKPEDFASFNYFCWLEKPLGDSRSEHLLEKLQKISDPDLKSVLPETNRPVFLSYLELYAETHLKDRLAMEDVRTVLSGLTDLDARDTRPLFGRTGLCQDPATSLRPAG